MDALGAAVPAPCGAAGRRFRPDEGMALPMDEPIAAEDELHAKGYDL